MIDNMHGIIMVIYHPFINHGLFESNIWHSMLALHKENNDLI